MGLIRCYKMAVFLLYAVCDDVFLALTKYKKRRYHMMKNLLTGTSEVQADLVRVSF